MFVACLCRVCVHACGMFVTPYVCGFRRVFCCKFVRVFGWTCFGPQVGTRFGAFSGVRVGFRRACVDFEVDNGWPQSGRSVAQDVPRACYNLPRRHVYKRGRYFVCKKVLNWAQPHTQIGTCARRCKSVFWNLPQTCFCVVSIYVVGISTCVLLKVSA